MRSPSSNAWIDCFISCVYRVDEFENAPQKRGGFCLRAICGQVIFGEHLKRVLHIMKVENGIFCCFPKKKACFGRIVVITCEKPDHAPFHHTCLQSQGLSFLKRNPCRYCPHPLRLFQTRVRLQHCGQTGSGCTPCNVGTCWDSCTRNGADSLNRRCDGSSSGWLRIMLVWRVAVRRKGFAAGADKLFGQHRGQGRVGSVLQPTETG